jgi:hypothetical protein
MRWHRASSAGYRLRTLSICAGAPDQPDKQVAPAGRAQLIDWRLGQARLTTANWLRASGHSPTLSPKPSALTNGPLAILSISMPLDYDRASYRFN